MHVIARLALPLVVVALVAAGCGSDGGGDATTAAAPSTTAAATTAAASTAAPSTEEAATSAEAATTAATSDAATTAAASTGADFGAALIKQALSAQGIDVTDEQVACIVEAGGPDLAAQLAGGSPPSTFIVAIVRCAGDAFASQIVPSIKEDAALAGITDEQAECVARVTIETLKSLSDEELIAAITSGTPQAPDAVKAAIVEQGSSECGVDAAALEQSLENNPA